MKNKAKRILMAASVLFMSLGFAVTPALAQTYYPHRNNTMNTQKYQNQNHYQMNQNQYQKQNQNHVSARLYPVNGSGVHGSVNLRQQPNMSGTGISVTAFGLHPQHTYVSLYYDNNVCNLEPYSADDVIGGRYTANRAGVGMTNGNATDNLDKINSVSVRDNNNFNLLACANIHPGK